MMSMSSTHPPGPMGMASRQAPPITLPGEHFAAALLFLALGTVGLVLIAGDLSTGAYPSPRVIGVTHFFTLGWITTSIMGALYQFLPVALGEPIRSIRLAHVTFGVYVIGLPLFIAGLLTGGRALMIPGAVTLASGLGLFLVNLGGTLARASRRDVTWWALLGAAVFLSLTVVFGLALAGNLEWGYLGTNRFVALGVHLHVALGGWVGLVIVGVAHRLLPMFLLSHGVDETLTRAAVALIAAGAAVLAVLHHAPAALGRWTPALLMGGGVACFLIQASRFYRKRVRRALDPGMRLVAVALGLLTVGLLLAGPVVLGRADSRLATGYVFLLVGGISLFVAAHYYKIIPFLVWYHRFGPLAGKKPVPRVSDLFHAPTATVAAWLLSLGVAGATIGIALDSEGLIRAAAVGLTAGVFVEGAQMIRLARTRPA